MIAAVAAGVLLVSLLIASALSRTRLFGQLTATGFLLGTLATISMLVLLNAASG